MYTKAKALQDVVSCFDPEYFIENHCHANSPVNGRCLMKLSPAQKKWIASARENQFTVIGEDRQIGKTQFISAYALWSALFNSYHNVCVFAGKHAWAMEIRDRVGYMYDLVPEYIKAKTVSSNRRIMEFENGSKIRFGAVTGIACKGLTVNTMLIDGIEYSDPRVAKEFFETAAPCMSFGKVITTMEMPWQQ